MALKSTAYLLRRLLPLLAAVVFLLAALAACHRAPDAHLALADSLMEARPDSALAILDSIPSASLSSASDRALHALLLTQARDKNYIVESSDSLISTAVDYFESHPNDSCLMKAYFYRANIYLNAGDYPASIRSALPALELARAVGSDYWQARAAHMLADNFSYTGDYIHALPYNRLAVEKFGAAARLHHRLYALCDYATNLGGAQHYDSAHCVYNALRAEARAGGLVDSSLMGYSFAGDLWFLVYENRFAEARQMADSCLAMMPRYVPSIPTRAFIAQSRIAFGDTVGISYELLSLLPYATRAEKAHLFRALQRYSEAAGRHLDASRWIDSLLALNYSVAESNLRDSGMEGLADYERDMAQWHARRAEYHRKATIKTIFGAALALIVVATIFLLLYARNRRRLALKASRINSLSEDIERLKAQQCSMSGMVKSKWSIIDHLCCQLDTETDTDADTASKLSTLRLKHIEDGLRGMLSDDNRTEIFAVADAQSMGAFSAVCNDCPGISDSDKLFAALVIVGFSRGSVVFLMGLKKKTFYSRRTRICEKIKASSLPRKDDFIQAFMQS